MSICVNFWVRLRAPRLLELLIMSGSSEKVYYAVGRGRETGIYDSWSECKAQTEGFNNSKYRKFYSLEDAKEFVDFWKNYSSPDKKSTESGSSEESEENKASVEVKVSEVNEHGVQEKIKQEVTSSPQNVSFLQTPSSPHSVSFEGKVNQNVIETLALNLRLDSFEKRFDTCLKEFGAITSEISNLKSEIKELKEILKSASRSGNSPKKTRDGLLQTTLNFNSPSSRSCSTRRSSSDSDEPAKKKARAPKRKLSRSNSSSNTKCSKGSIEDFIANIKTEDVDLTLFTFDKDDFVEVYTDGSSRSNGRADAKAGIGVWFGDNHPLNVAEPVVGSPTNITAEIQAARVAIQLAIKCGIKKLKILTDSEFVINCATKWIHRWKTNGWTLRGGGPVKNRKELEALDKFASQINVKWEKVAGHSKIQGNEIADRLANEGASRYQR